ncbi:MAG: hypothetical protein ABI782_01100 [Anaerolineaceae bacterium]
MRVIRGLAVAFALFAGSFALHIIGGATDQRWLFAIAVGLIYVTATGFPAIALVTSGLTLNDGQQMKLVLGIGALAGVCFTIAALWAANGRAFAWWQFPLGPALVLFTSIVLLAMRRFAGRPAKAIATSCWPTVPKSRPRGS